MLGHPNDPANGILRRIRLVKAHQTFHVTCKINFIFRFREWLFDSVLYQLNHALLIYADIRPAVHHHIGLGDIRGKADGMGRSGEDCIFPDAYIGRIVQQIGIQRPGNCQRTIRRRIDRRGGHKIGIVLRCQEHQHLAGQAVLRGFQLRLEALRIAGIGLLNT